MKITTEKGSMYLPDFIIIGAEKSGTTSLFHHLASHPSISAPEVKEPNYLSIYRSSASSTVRAASRREGITSLSAYSELFRPGRATCLTGEASVLYLYDYEAVTTTIKELYGADISNLKVIVLLRNPTDRAWSSYQMKRRDGRETLPFNEAWREETIAKRLAAGDAEYFDYRGFGKYAEQVGAWQKVVPGLLAIQYEEMVVNPQGVFDSVCDYLEIPRTRLREPNKKYNASGTPRHWLAGLASRFIFRPNQVKRILRYLIPKAWRYQIRIRAAGFLLTSATMPPDARAELTRYYRPEVDRLEALLGWDLSDWKEVREARE